MESPSPAAPATCLLLTVAGVYDLWALTNNKETISSFVYRHRRWARYVNVYLVLHFERLIPSHLDPLRRWKTLI